MDPQNNDNWLARLSADDWLAAATNELVHCRHALERRGYRAGVTHARRAAGMACNGVLRVAFDASWGRSYMDHVIALAADERVPQTVRDAAKELVNTRPAPPELISLGKPDLGSLLAAETIIAWARVHVAELMHATAAN